MTPNVCPIFGTGADAATPAVDTANETTGPPGVNNIDGTQSIPAATNISGKTIADQLAEYGLTWKSYQESLPPQGADSVNMSDGLYTDGTNFAAIKPALTPALTASGVVALYAAKHNPFVTSAAYRKASNPGATLRTSPVSSARTACIPISRPAVSPLTPSSRRTSAMTSMAAATERRFAPSIRTATARRPDSIRP